MGLSTAAAVVLLTLLQGAAAFKGKGHYTIAEGAACSARDECAEGTSCVQTDEYTPSRCLRKMCAGRETCMPKNGRWQHEGLCLDDADDDCEEGREECPGCVVKDTCRGVVCAGGSCHVNKYGEARCYRHCKMTCGREVWHGWTGKDDGNNACNDCECKDGSMVCDTKVCEQRTPECLGKGDVCFGGPEGVDRRRECPGHLVCDRLNFRGDDDTHVCIGSDICCEALPGCRANYEWWPNTCTVKDFETRECVEEHMCCSFVPCRRTEYLPVCSNRYFCGGAQGIKCGAGMHCVDDPDDDCDPDKGGIACKGCCVGDEAPLGGLPKPPSAPSSWNGDEFGFDA